MAPGALSSGIPLPPPVPEPRRDEVLARGAMELLGRMRYSSNATFLVRLADGDDAILAIYKPRKGERPLWDFPSGTLCQREVAAHEISRQLGWDIVPPTVLRDGPHGVGMVQAFVEHDPEQHYLTLRDRHAERFKVFAAFDVVVNNADRKAGHCLQGADGRLWGIDHGLTFHPEPKLRTVIWDFVGEPLGASVAGDLRRLAGWLRRSAATTVAELLGPDEIDALVARVDRLVRHGELPEPETHHPYPWPIV